MMRMINFLKAIFSNKQNRNNKSNDTFTICQGKKFNVLKRIDPQNGNVEVIIKDKKTLSVIFSKVLLNWYIDNSNFPEVVLTSDEKFLIICAYYYNPIDIIDLEKGVLYWEINQFNDIYEFVVDNDQIKIKNCVDENQHLYQTWDINIQNKIISEIK